VLLFGTTVWVLLVLWRRDFRSVTLKTLAELGAADGTTAEAESARAGPAV